MSKEKQTYNPCDDCQYSYTKNNQESRMCKICELEYFKDRLLDYRKQSEGEWVCKWKSTFPQYEPSEYECSVCKYRRTVLHKYCPNCGSKMKGGAE